MKTYRVDGVYVGRKAVGNPWIFAGVDKATLTFADRLPVILQHIEDEKHFYGDWVAARMIRKHLTQYMSDLPEWPEMKRGIYDFESIDPMRDFLQSFGNFARRPGDNSETADRSGDEDSFKTSAALPTALAAHK